MNDLVLNKSEAADFLKISERSIDYLVQTNQIPYARLGKRNVRFSRERLLQWISEREGIELRYKTQGKKI